MRYFARHIRVSDYPHCGDLCWCVLDSRGGYFVVASEAAAVSEAMLRNVALQAAS
jgi:hypothetical protein